MLQCFCVLCCTPLCTSTCTHSECLIWKCKMSSFYYVKVCVCIHTKHSWIVIQILSYGIVLRVHSSGNFIVIPSCVQREIDFKCKLIAHRGVWFGIACHIYHEIDGKYRRHTIEKSNRIEIQRQNGGLIIYLVYFWSHLQPKNSFSCSIL